MDLGLMKILLKFLNYPLNISPLYSQPTITIFFFGETTVLVSQVYPVCVIDLSSLKHAQLVPQVFK